MRNEYDFTNARRNPYVKTNMMQVTLNLDCKTISYFKNIASKTGIPYQVLISSYLKDYVEKKRELILN